MNINWQKLFVSLTVLALGLTLAGCGKTASDSGGGSSGLVPRSYTRTSDTVYDLEGLLNALNNVDDVIIPADTEIIIDEAIIINAGKNLIVAEGATLNVSDNVKPELSGTITVKSGAVLIDYGAYIRTNGDYGPWQTNDNASIVFETGANGYRYHPISHTLVPFIGGDSAVINLTEGKFILKNFVYELQGNAKVNNQFELNKTEKAIVASGATLVLDNSAIITLNGTIVVNEGGKLRDTGSGTIWSGKGTGSLTFKKGSEGYLYGESTPIIGDNSAIVKLDTNATAFTLYKDKYEVAGTITIQENFVTSLPVNGAAGAKIIVSVGKTVTLSGNSLTLAASKTYVWDNNTWKESTTN
jgi:hypothetical protein